MIDLNDMECLYNKGILHKYVRKTDGTMYSAKSVIAPENTRPESHPMIQNLEKLSKFSHPNIPRYHGWSSKKGDGFTEILIFLENSEGSLGDYLKDAHLTKDEITRMTTELIDVLIFLDREAYALPSYLTPHNVMVSKDAAGKIHFKPFGTLPHDENRKLTEEDMKYIAPELFERLRLKRTHINVNAEKAVFYSLGILIIYAATQDLITNGRDGIDASHFTTRNQERETEAAQYGKTKIQSMYNDNKFNEALGKLLVYPEKERADFRIWQLSQREPQGSGKQKKAAQSNPKQNKGNNVYKNDQAGYQGGGGGVNVNKEAGHSKKNACKNACCNIF